MCALPSAPFDPAKSIFAGLSVIQLKLDPALSGVAAEADDDTFTKAGHTLVDGQGVVFVSGTGFTGITSGNTYYVRDADQEGGTFKLASAVGGSAIDITLDGSTGVFQPVLIFEAPMLDDDPDQETKSIERPNSRGVLRKVRTVETKGQEKWTFKLDEVKRLLEIFGGKLRGRKSGTCTLWIPDPDDASGMVALKSQDDFDVTVTRSGKVTFGDNNFSSSTIQIESNESDDVSWTADSDA